MSPQLNIMMTVVQTIWWVYWCLSSSIDLLFCNFYTFCSLYVCGNVCIQTYTPLLQPHYLWHVLLLPPICKLCCLYYFLLKSAQSCMLWCLHCCTHGCLVETTPFFTLPKIPVLWTRLLSAMASHFSSSKQMTAFSALLCAVILYIFSVKFLPFCLMTNVTTMLSLPMMPELWPTSQLAT